MKNLTMTTLTKWLNENRVKKNRKPFTIGDTQGYIARKRLPDYLGGNEIIENDEIEGVRLYNLTTNQTTNA